MTLTLLPFAAEDARAQSLDQILARHFEASGQELLDGVTTVRSTGRAVQMGMEMPFIQVQKRPDKMYLEIDIQGMKLIQAYDGTEGWSVEPWVSDEPRHISGPELENLSRTAGIDSDLVNWQGRGYLLTYSGLEQYEGGDAYLLELEKEKGVVYRYLIDSDTYLLSKIVTLSDYAGNMVEGETILGDYRNINGISVPTRTEIRFGGQTQMTNYIDKVEFDVSIDDAIFRAP